MKWKSGGGVDLGAYANAIIDEVKIWNYALGEDEIKMEYNRGSALSVGVVKSADNNGATVTGNLADYCVPGDTAKCDAPILELKMEYKNESTLYDTSGNNNNLSFGAGASAPTNIFGKHGKGFDFDGINDFAYLSSPVNLRISHFTLSAWVKPNSVSVNDPSRPYILALQPRGAWGTGKGYSLAIGGDGSPRVQIGDASSVWTTVIGETILSTNIWYYIVGTYDGNELKIHLNGVEDGILNTSKTISYADSLVEGPNPQTFYIGAQHSSANTSNTTTANMYFFDGSIDDVRIYNYARTPAQIAWDYNRGKPVAEYRFDECQGTITHDESGNGKHGTITIGASGAQTTVGTCGSPSSASAWYNGVDGKRNYSLNFDGTDDFADVGDLGLNINAVGFWIKADGLTDGIIDLDGGTRTISVSGGIVSANGFASPTIYIDGQNKTDIDANWHHILITTATAIDANNFDIGRIGTDYFAGQIDEVKLYNYALTGAQVKMEYNGGAVRLGE